MLYDVYNITWDTLRSPRVFFLHRIRYVHVVIHYLNHQLIEIFEFKYKHQNAYLIGFYGLSRHQGNILLFKCRMRKIISP